MSYNVTIPQVQDEELMNNINELAEYFLGKKINADETIPNPFGSKDKIVLELETTPDGSKKLTHESEIVLGALFDEKSPIVKHMSSHLLAYMAQNAALTMSNAAANKQLFWISSRFNGATMSYQDSKKLFDEAFMLSKQITKLQKAEAEIVEENNLSKIILQFMLALEDAEILAKIKNVLGKLILQDDDLKAQWEAMKTIPNPVSMQPEPVSTEPATVEQENIVEQIIGVNAAEEAVEDTSQTETAETPAPEQPQHTPNKGKHHSKRMEFNNTNNQQSVEALAQ